MGLTVNLYRRFVAFKTSDIDNYNFLLTMDDVEPLLESTGNDIKEKYHSLLKDLLSQANINVTKKDKNAIKACTGVIKELKSLYQTTNLT